MTSEPKVIFFDLGDTLGSALLTHAPQRLASFDVYPFVPAMLGKLRGDGHRLGIISNTGEDNGDHVDSVLAGAGILQFFDPALRIYSKDVGLKKDSPAIFHLAAQRAGQAASPAQCLFVGEDLAERAFAAAAGLMTCPHPLLAGEVLAGHALRYARLTVPPEGTGASWRALLATLPLVPQHITGPGGNVVVVMLSERAIPELANRRFGIDLLGAAGLPSTTDLYILRDDIAAESGFLAPQGQAASLFVRDRGRLLVGTSSDGLIVALPPEVDLGELHFEHTRHGHTLKLLPDPALLEPTAPGAAPFAAPEALRGPVLSDVVRAALARIDAAALGDRVERYSGAKPPDVGGAAPITSRHIAHPDNRRAEALLAEELATRGGGRLTVRLHRFTDRGRTLHNVEAELAGASRELVLVTAHMDSTAAQTLPFDASTDPAPGADDDASGVAAVLTLAERFAELAADAPPARTIRFVLFNAEEVGLVGSCAYARLQWARQAAIAAVFQMDMIGFNRVGARSWELHTGFPPSPVVEARSGPLAELVASLVPEVAPALEAPQIYRSSSPGGDPAYPRSDHTSFHEFGFPAICASEDLFAGPGPAAPAPEGNPNYHKREDTFVDAAYAADIARAVAAAAWTMASGGGPGLVAGDGGPEEIRHAARIGTGLATDQAVKGAPMSDTREVDTRKSARGRMESAPAPVTAPRMARHATETAGSPAAAVSEPPQHAQGSLIDRAIALVRRNAESFGAGRNESIEYVPDPVVQRTSAGATAVNLHQFYRGIPLFQMTQTVRFNPRRELDEAAGHTAEIPQRFSIEPRLDAIGAVRKAAEHIASSGKGEEIESQFGKNFPAPTIDLGDYQPEIVSGFTLPAQPTVVSNGPFENAIPAHLVIFVHPEKPRLAWQTVLTFPDHADQFAVIVAADEPVGEILFAKSTMHHVLGKGRVFEFNPGVSDRRLIPFPRPIEDYPPMPSLPLAGFPRDWIDGDQTLGNATSCVLNSTSTRFRGVLQGNGSCLFDPAGANRDDQKILNVFYFCNYMHDFLYVLGFDEGSGNFQRVNFTNAGLGNDQVNAQSHNAQFNGIASMLTGPDGQPPLMRMGFHPDSNRHTAFDSDVVFHEYVHGLTNRLVGGRLDSFSLSEPQSRGMGEGWSDFVAVTVHNYFNPEKNVIGDWTKNDPAGIRHFPYDDAYPLKYQDIAGMTTIDIFGQVRPLVHDIGEVWCAALMMMTRKLRRALGDDRAGYRLAWQIVVDGLKTTSANPTFLQARDQILKALDELRTVRISPELHRVARRAAWESFAHFGMGHRAFSEDAGLAGINADSSLPADL